MAGHEERAHAILSASGAKRWMACTPSALLEAEKPDSTSPYAEEGTKAHEVSEVMLARELGQINKATATRRINKMKKESDWITPGMIEYCETYTSIVMERVNQYDKPEVRLEKRVNFSAWVPEGFGTGDVLIMTDDTVEIIDLKYGKGVPVSAIENEQLKLYGLGAYQEYLVDEPENVIMTIVQPRLDSVSTFEMNVPDLLDWAEKVVAPKAYEAYQGQGEFVPGDHCKFCKLRGECTARAEEAIETAKEEFADDPVTLPPERIGELLSIVPNIKSWIADFEEATKQKAIKDKVTIPGYKVVAGKTSREITDPFSVEMTLLNEKGFTPEQILKPKELLALTKLEKLLGRKEFTETLGEYVTKKEGAPTLVPEDDKRPALIAGGDFDDLI